MVYWYQKNTAVLQNTEYHSIKSTAVFNVMASYTTCLLNTAVNRHYGIFTWVYYRQAFLDTAHRYVDYNERRRVPALCLIF